MIPSRIHRPQQPTETSREYSLAIDVQVCRERIATDEAKIEHLEREVWREYEAKCLLRKELADLRQQLRQYETHAAQVTLENARLTFAIEAAAWVVEDLKRLVPEDDRSEVEAMGRSTIQ